MKKRILVVDDMQHRVEEIKSKLGDYFEIVWARTYDDAVIELAAPLEPFSFVFLDCDLDDPAGNGVDLVKLYQKKLNRRQTIIHSMNLEGGYEMKKLIPSALHLPFDMLVQILEGIEK